MKTQYTIEWLKNSPYLLFEGISGSRAYGTNIEGKSDTDIRGVFMLPQSELYGLRYVEQINDDKNDIIYYELGRLMQLLSANNPNILELLNLPEDCVLYCHPLFEQVITQKSLFLSKLCRETFGGYAIQQIKKARGLNKKIVNPMEEERKNLLDFCFITHAQGSIPLKEWLSVQKLTQKQLGLVNVPNMKELYAVFVAIDETTYQGVQRDEDSQEVCLSSVSKEVEPVAYLSFNKDGYSVYCKQYKEYWNWVEKRNPDRYLQNIEHGKNYDSKNLMHCVRLLETAIDIVEKGELLVRRPNRAYLLDIRKGVFEYDEIMLYAESLIIRLDEVNEVSTLQKTPHYETINQLLVDIRTQFYNKN